jgi:TonB family protein
MFAEGDLAPPGPEILFQPPSPPPAQDEPGQTGESAGESRIAEAREEGDLLEAEAGDGRFRVPLSREESGSPPGDSRQQEKGQRLRQALSRMEAGGSVGAGGGSPYRFDNPTAGLSTPSGTLSFDTKGFDWGPYARRIYWIIWTNWHARMPPAIYTGVKGTVTVRFIIEKNGTLSGIRILSPSGVPAYDNAATLALEASNPLPPLPESFPRESEGVTGRFLYNMWR